MKQFINCLMLRLESINYMKTNPNPYHDRIIKYIQDYNPYSGVREVHIGTWVYTDAGWGTINAIEDLDTHQLVNNFYEDETNYRMEVCFHIKESFDLRYGRYKGELAKIDLQKQEVRFMGNSKHLFKCPYCDNFITANKSIISIHLSNEHQKGHIDFGAISAQNIKLTICEYDFRASDQ